ncbi:acyl-CoA dehydrogenase family protein [Chloroflexota bacterium]
MDFELTDKQKKLKKEVHELLEKEIDPIVTKTDRDRSFSAEKWKGVLKKLVPYGVISGHAPKELGGLADGETDHITQGLLMEELAWTWAALSEIVIINSLATERIKFIGTPAQAKRFVPGIAKGDILFCSGNSEPEHGSDAAAYKTLAVRDGDTWTVNGTKTWSTGGFFADHCLLLAQIDPSRGAKGLQHFVLDKKVSPWEAEEIYLTGVRSEGLGLLKFKNVKVPHEYMLGEEPGTSYKKQLIQWGIIRAYVAFQEIGVARRALEAAVDYSLKRIQFGKPIASFQMVQDKIVQATMELEAARLMAYRACHVLNSGERSALACSTAKVFATQVAMRVTDISVDIHGSRGLVEDEIPERCYREARTFMHPDGPFNINKLIAGNEILGINAIRR